MLLALSSVQWAQAILRAAEDEKNGKTGQPGAAKGSTLQAILGHVKVCGSRV